MWFLILLGILVLLYLILVLYLFYLAFVKQKNGDFENVDSIVNKPLWEYKEAIREGINYINTQPHKWVYTTSFDGLKLAARYFNRDYDKTIILFHGYRSSSARDFSCAVKMYLDFGFNVLLVDQRTHGRSEGKLITFGVKESQDAISWTLFIQEKYNTKNIILSGMSMGATTVLFACGLGLPSSVKGIIADSGFTSPIDIIRSVGERYFKINPSLLIPSIDLCCRIFGKFSITESNTIDAIKKTDVPILLIHGKADGFVPCEMSQKVFDSDSSKSRLVLVENANHGLGFLVDTKNVKAELKKFLDSIFNS